MYSYITDNGCVDKKIKGMKTFAIKQESSDSRTTISSLQNNKAIFKTQHRFMSKEHKRIHRKGLQDYKEF